MVGINKLEAVRLLFIVVEVYGLTANRYAGNLYRDSLIIGMIVTRPMDHVVIPEKCMTSLRRNRLKPAFNDILTEVMKVTGNLWRLNLFKYLITAWQKMNRAILCICVYKRAPNRHTFFRMISQEAPVVMDGEQAAAWRLDNKTGI